MHRPGPRKKGLVLRGGSVILGSLCPRSPCLSGETALTLSFWSERVESLLLGSQLLTRKPGLTSDVLVTHSLLIPDWTGAMRAEVLPASTESPDKGGAAGTGKGPGQGGEDDAGN